MHGRRPILYNMPQAFEALLTTLAKARADLSEQHFQHLCELADQNAELVQLKGQVAELRDILLMMVSIRRAEADTDVVGLRHQLETLLVRLERRDGQALH
jgi:hypothetical protein